LIKHAGASCLVAGGPAKECLPMVEKIIIAILVALALAYVVRRALRKGGSSCGCGCSDGGSGGCCSGRGQDIKSSPCECSRKS